VTGAAIPDPARTGPPPQRPNVSGPTASGPTAPGPTAPGPTASGHPGVDAAIAAMVNAADLPPPDQIAEYEAAHRELQDILGTIDQA
jgi:hypothetical protein